MAQVGSVSISLVRGDDLVDLDEEKAGTGKEGSDPYCVFVLGKEEVDHKAQHNRLSISVRVGDVAALGRQRWRLLEVGFTSPRQTRFECFVPSCQVVSLTKRDARSPE